MSSDLPPLPPGPAAGSRWRHYKGGLYIVIDVARHSETLDPLVVYRSLHDGGVWCRPLAMWNEEHDGVPRFAPLP